MAAVAELAGVTLRRGNAVLLNSVSLIVDESERWVVIGPNGAGKTTLLQLLGAQLYPSDGVVGLLGEVVGYEGVYKLTRRPDPGQPSASASIRMMPSGPRM